MRFAFIVWCILAAVGNSAIARQVKGRPTLPSDCHADEIWVRDHGKSTGHWTAYCRQGGAAPSSAYRFWALKMKSGRPSDWPWSKEQTSGWTTDEVEKVLAAVGILAEGLWSKSIKGIYRMKKAKDYPNPAASGGGYIVLYDTAFQKRNDLARIIAHEAAHEVYRSFSEEQRMDYAFSSGWACTHGPRGERVCLSRECCFAREGGKVSPDEDFAINIEYFLFDPGVLRSKVPRAHTWILKHFDDSFKLGDGHEKK